VNVLRKTPRGVSFPVSVECCLRALEGARQPSHLWEFVAMGGVIYLPDGTSFRLAEPDGSPPRPGWCTGCFCDPCGYPAA
jgi:hypothetical protein